MLQLKPDECRVLGVLVEKAQTTPQQYPLTLNSLTLGCNQKNNRFPVVEWDEDRVYDAVDGLRAKGLVHEVLLTGSRVAKFRHTAREILAVDTPQLVVLAELLLRGPQSLGDLRSHASRMHAFDSLEAVKSVVDGLMARPEPMVRELPPQPGSRAARFSQLLCPALHHFDDAAPPAPSGPSDHGREEFGAADRAESAQSPGLAARVAALEEQVRRLDAVVHRLAQQSGLSP